MPENNDKTVFSAKKCRKIFGGVIYYMQINAKDLDYQSLNQQLRGLSGEITVTHCCGQRFIGAGMSEKSIIVEGVPGNALGAYLNGARITVKANAQDAVGDTMNEGSIVVYGNIGDAAGYAMRGGEIYVEKNAGYRAGIHMKAYQQKVPVMVIGGTAGSFLGEYQAGGVIVVLGLGAKSERIIGNFPCTGMHGGKMILRGDGENIQFPSQVTACRADDNEREKIRGIVEKYCALFSQDPERIMDSPFTIVTPDSRNPYKQMYVQN